MSCAPDTVSFLRSLEATQTSKGCLTRNGASLILIGRHSDASKAHLGGFTTIEGVHDLEAPGR